MVVWTIQFMPVDDMINEDDLWVSWLVDQRCILNRLLTVLTYVWSFKLITKKSWGFLHLYD